MAQAQADLALQAFGAAARVGHDARHVADAARLTAKVNDLGDL